MRLIKQRLLEMVEGLQVFLDVDDLESTDGIEGCIERSEHVLVFCTDKYFKSKSCMRDLVYSTKLKKKTTALIELDKSRGGLDEREVRHRARAGLRVMAA